MKEILESAALEATKALAIIRALPDIAHDATPEEIDQQASLLAVLDDEVDKLTKIIQTALDKAYLKAG